MIQSELYNSQLKSIYTLDKKALLLKANSEDEISECRLSPMHMDLLALLFECHPNPVPYKGLINIVKGYKLECPDVLRLHRKMSELRLQIEQSIPQLKDAIINVRGVGYSLPLSWRAYGRQATEDIPILELDTILNGLNELINHSSQIVSKAKLTKYNGCFINEREPFIADIQKIVSHFNILEHQLLSILSLRASDFKSIRIQYCLSLLRTYIGLSRMCEGEITKDEWGQYHKAEVNEVFEELCKWVRQAESTSINYRHPHHPKGAHHLLGNAHMD